MPLFESYLRASDKCGGPGGVETHSSFNSVNVAMGVAFGMALANPLMLPFALLTSGGSSTTYKYTLFEMNPRGRLSRG